jgi:hypothetical protein
VTSATALLCIMWHSSGKDGNPASPESNQARGLVGRVTPVRAVLCELHCDGAQRTARPTFSLFPFRGKAPQWRFVFTLMTLELGLVPLPLYARNR